MRTEAFLKRPKYKHPTACPSCWLRMARALWAVWLKSVSTSGEIQSNLCRPGVFGMEMKFLHWSLQALLISPRSARAPWLGPKNLMRYLNGEPARRLGTCVFCAPLDRHIGRVSVDISTDVQPICRRHVGWHSADVSVDILTNMSTEILADISMDTSTESCCATVSRYIDQ